MSSQHLCDILIFFTGKPQSDNNITLGVTDTTGIEFSVTVIAHPEPQYELEFENRTTINRFANRIALNAVNNFTIHFNQTIVEQSDYGVYRLRVYNSFGETYTFVNVIPQSKFIFNYLFNIYSLTYSIF